MQEFDRAATAHVLSDLHLTPAQRKLSEYWLSLWTDNALPGRAQFNPAQLKTLLPTIAIYDVIPDQSVTVRLAGTLYSAVLGMEITGMDWISAAPPEYRVTRLRIFTEIARGAIGRGVRGIELDSGKSYDAFELMLPFAPERDGENHPVVGQVDWNPEQRFSRIRSREQAMGASTSFETIPLPALERR